MKIIQLKDTLTVLTGLHIGGGDDTMKIGGIDNPVIKHINTDEPYIPGSSLKGKMRSLLERYYGLHIYTDGNPFDSSLLDRVRENQDIAKNLVKIFGDGAKEKNQDIGITRITFGDCYLTDSMKQSLKNNEIVVSEAKYENSIDRMTGTASNPRQTERVPAGVKFDYDIRLKIMDQDQEKSFIQIIKTGLLLIENDFLGGNGSRGYGRVKFSNKENWTVLLSPHSVTK